mgnify:CR=1 FL=1
MKVYISLPVTGTSDYKERAEAIEKSSYRAGTYSN